MGWAILAAALALALAIIKRPGGLFWSPLFDVAHVVLSAGAVFLALRLRDLLHLHCHCNPGVEYALVLVSVAALGGCLEIFQLYGPGDASWGDLGRDVLGASSATMLAISADRRIGAIASRRIRAWLLRVIAVGLLCLSVATLARVMVAVAYRRSVFPTLCGFESRWDRLFTSTANGALLAFESPPIEFTRARGSAVGKVVFVNGEKFPQFELRGGFGDWSLYENLAFEILSLEPEPVALTLRVHDRSHVNRYSDRFNRELTVHPGQNSIAVRIAEIQSAPEHRAMDLGAIAAVALFSDSTQRTFTLYFDEFRLN